MNIVKAKKTELRAGLATDGDTLALRQFLDSNDNELALADFGTFLVVVVKQGDKTEIIRCNGITQNTDGTADLAIESNWRNIPAKPPFSGSATGKAFQTGAEVIVTNDPYTMSFMLQTNNNDPQTVLGDIRFPNPVDDANAATKGYADGLAAAGAPTASQTTRGIAMLAESPNEPLGNVTITIATPAVFTLTAHGLQVGDTIQLSTTGSLPTGLAVSTDYYVISAGLTANDFQVSATLNGTAIDTSGVQSGTHSVTRTTPYVVTTNNTLLPTTDEKAALAGGGDFGTPSTSNKFLTEDYRTNLGIPTYQEYTTATAKTARGDATSRFDITNPAGDTYRYTWDGIGTNPNISLANFAIGDAVEISSSQFDANNTGVFVITDAGTNYFEVTNVNGVAESALLLNAPMYVFTPHTWTKPANLKYILVEVIGAGGGGEGGEDSTSGTDYGGNGGGAGGYGRKIILASDLDATVPVMIGSKGGGGSNSNGAGSNGQTSAFGQKLIAQPGTGGTSSTSGNGGTAASEFDLVYDGQHGGVAVSADNAPGSHGGNSFYGRGGKGGQNTTGGTGTKGSGGGGGDVNSSNGYTGGAGGDGYILITEYYI